MIKQLLMISIAMCVAGCSLAWDSELTTRPEANVYAKLCVFEHCVGGGGEGNSPDGEHEVVGQPE